MSCPHADIKQDENTGRKYCHACGKEMDSVKDSKPKSDFIDTTLDMFSATEARLVTSEASEIGHIYQKAKASLIDSVVLLIECGERLKAQKDKLEHGQWLPWLEANRQELGFGERTARYLMDAASRPYSTNRKLTADLDETTALDISRQIWGNRESDLEPDDSIEMEPDDEPQPPEGSCERPSAEPETKHRPRRRHPSSIANQNIRAS